MDTDYMMEDEEENNNNNKNTKKRRKSGEKEKMTMSFADSSRTVSISDTASTRCGLSTTTQ